LAIAPGTGTASRECSCDTGSPLTDMATEAGGNAGNSAGFSKISAGGTARVWGGWIKRTASPLIPAFSPLRGEGVARLGR
jgi:hypothetical protein